MPTAKVTKNVSAAIGGGNVLCSTLISIKTKAWLYSFAPYNLLKMMSRNRAAPYEFIRKQRATIIGKPYSVCQMPLEISCFCWTSDTVNKPSLYIDLITAWSFMAVT